MCDIWRANKNMQEISPDELSRHLGAWKDLGVSHVLLSGGEALMHSNLWSLCQGLKSISAKITLLSTGLLLAREAENIRDWIDEVILSLDGSPPVHDQIRNIPRAYERLAAGVAAMREVAPEVEIGARCVIQKANYHDFQKIVSTARELNVSWISFLAADVTTDAFNRPDGWTGDRRLTVQLSPQECDEFEVILTDSEKKFSAEYRSSFIVESPQKMSNILQYYRAINGDAEFPTQKCNAPWVSAVLDADGTIRPCFFHPPYDQTNGTNFQDVLNSKSAVQFRQQLDIQRDPICQRCVCTLNIH